MTTSTDGRDGLLLVDKPAGVSSHDVASVARRAVGERRIGHAGTLDPFATGLLVLLVGRATRLLPHLPGEPKVYEATIRFGEETETEDLHGAVTREAPLPTRAAILGALPQFVGEIEQVPPAYSAKRVDGERAYKAARAGRTVELKPVRISVFKWEVLHLTTSASPLIASAIVRITCGGGTYIRSLARDLARAAGSAAHLTQLRRVAAGAFTIEDASSLAELRDKRAPLRPALAALPGFPQQALDDTEIAKVVRGIDVPARVDGGWAALTRADAPDVLVALAERARDTYHGQERERFRPRVVMHEPAEVPHG